MAMTPLVIAHMIPALVAVPLGAYVLLARKGNRVHRTAGRVWAVLMLIAAVTSFWITGINGLRWSWIHLISIWTLMWLGIAIWRVRNENIFGHRRAMTGVFIGLLIAGAWASMPGRTLGDMLWG